MRNNNLCGMLSVYWLMFNGELGFEFHFDIQVPLFAKFPETRILL